MFTTSAIGKFIEEFSVGNTMPSFVVDNVEVDNVVSGEEFNVVEDGILVVVVGILLFVDF